MTPSQRRWFITRVSSGFRRELAREAVRRGEAVAGTVRKGDQLPIWRQRA